MGWLSGTSFSGKQLHFGLGWDTPTARIGKKIIARYCQDDRIQWNTQHNFILWTDPCTMLIIVNTLYIWMLLLKVIHTWRMSCLFVTGDILSLLEVIQWMIRQILSQYRNRKKSICYYWRKHWTKNTPRFTYGEKNICVPTYYVRKYKKTTWVKTHHADM